MRKLLLILLLLFPVHGAWAGIEDHPLRISYKNSDAPNLNHYNYRLTISKTVFINGEKHKFHALAFPLSVHKNLNRARINYPDYKKLKLVVGSGSAGYGSSAISQDEANKQAIAECKKTNRWDHYSGTSRNPYCIIVRENKNVVFEKNYNNFLSTIDSTKEKWAKIENEQDSYELVEDDFSYVKSTMKEEEMEVSTNTSTTLSNNNLAILNNSVDAKKRWRATCKEYGFKDETEEMGKCILRIQELEFEQMKLQIQINGANQQIKNTRRDQEQAAKRQRALELEQEKILQQQKHNLGMMQLQQSLGILKGLQTPRTTCTFNELMNNMVCR